MKLKIQHMIFYCILVENIWKKVSAILKLNIAREHLVIGFMETKALLFKTMLHSLLHIKILNTR